ncbi:HNH endonuclease [Pantoea phage Nifs112]|nr:HNH endonuclease [Pantoea phage Nifs112]
MSLRYVSNGLSCLVKDGNPIGWQGDRGHWKVDINGVERKAHVVIWELHYGPVPIGYVVDHVDNDASNNDILNLRLATKSQNAMNSKTYTTNNSGCKGVSWHMNRAKTKGKWRVQLMIMYRTYSFGTYDDHELACLVAEEARDKYHKEFARA